MAHCKVTNSDVELDNYFNIYLKGVANFIDKIKIPLLLREHIVYSCYINDRYLQWNTTKGINTL